MMKNYQTVGTIKINTDWRKNRFPEKKMYVVKKNCAKYNKKTIQKFEAMQERRL